MAADFASLNQLVDAPCRACGARLQFSAELQKMQCTHCGSAEEIAFTKDKLVENAFDYQLHNGELTHAPTEEKRVLACAGCGARTTVNFDTPTIQCAFCGSKNVNPEATNSRLIAPAGVLPFRLGRSQITEKFRDWVGGSWLAPNDLKTGAVLDNLHGLYVPFWTFDAQAHSDWSAEAGHYYYVAVQSRDANGRSVTTQERRVRWEHRRGSHAFFYDDHLEMASKNLTQQEHNVRECASFALEDVVDYDPRVLLGWEAEVYSIDLQESARKAQEAIEAREEEACSRLVGGDTQRNLQVDTELSAQTFKHLLLPLWICSYIYRGTLYRFLVNGQTGRIAGDRPISKWKVFFLVLAALVVGGLLLYLYGQRH
jgi:DNA-directed RNA polymerase subunit RPC12/RpoP